MRINELANLKNTNFDLKAQQTTGDKNIFNGYFPDNDFGPLDSFSLNPTRQYATSDGKYGHNENGMYYEVKKGDNLTAIAKRLGLTISELQAFNPNLNIDNLKIGQKIYFKGEMYKIKSGDTLSQIAVKYGVLVEDLKKWNSLTNDNITEGKYLLIVSNNGAEQKSRTEDTPAPASSTKSSNNTSSTVYVVVSGDTLSGIAAKLEVSLQQIKDANKGIDYDHLSIGQKIIIPRIEQGSKAKKGNSTKSQNSNNTTKSNSDYQCIYTVLGGDTISSIKAKYGVTEQQLLEANPELKKVQLKNGGYNIPIHPGNKLNIPWPKKPEPVLNLEDLSDDERDFLGAVCQKESSNNPSATNRKKGQGYLGFYQMGEQALKDIGVYSGDQTSSNDWIGNFKENRFQITSKEDFLSSPKKQHQAMIAYCRRNWENLHFECEKANINIESYIGKSINGVRITKSGLLAGAHLVGVGGVVKFLTTTDSNILNKIADKNGTHVSEYMELFGNYNIPHFTEELT